MVSLIRKWKRFYNVVRELVKEKHSHDETKMLLGTILSRFNREKNQFTCLRDLEFKVFSQFGDDGIIDWLTRTVPIRDRTFIEFGVEDYTESNTRFLLQNQNWKGLVLDGSAENIAKIKNSPYYWKHDLTAIHSFVTVENINTTLEKCGLSGEIGLLHIDIDGNDYWVWNAIDIVSPQIVIMEYNAVFGSDRAITVPYSANFIRNREHYSNLYFGASLRALEVLGKRKGYRLIGCNTAGNNAYFLKDEDGLELIPTLSSHQAFQEAKFRECRDLNGELTFADAKERHTVVTGLKVYNVETKQLESI